MLDGTNRRTNAVYLTEDNFGFESGIEDRTDDEFAAATFSPDHETLYCNIQASSGLTFTIWGPWGGGGL